MGRFAGLTALMLLASASAFAPLTPRALVRGRHLTSTPAKMPIIVTGNNVELTTSLLEYATKKVDKVINKHREFVTKCEVHLVVGRNPSVTDADTATATVAVKGGVIRDSHSSSDMYASLDAMSDGLARKLRKYKDQRRDRLHSAHGESSFRGGADLEAVEDEHGLEEDEYAAEAAAYATDLNVVKTKSFSMQPISVEEAAFCLDYLDHPFYVFRNEASGEVSVLYKRSGGGLGLIEPEA